MTSQDNSQDTGASRLKDIPDYRTTDDDTRGMLDAIIEGVGEMTEAKARTFGNEVLGTVQATSDKIVNAMQSEENGVFREPLQNCMDDMKSLNLEDLQSTITGYISKGANAVSKNKGKAALTAVGALTVPFATAAAWAAYKVGGKYIPRKEQPISIEDVSERIKKGVVKSESHVKALQMAQTHVPVLLSRIDALGSANRDAFISTSYHIAAGREIALRMRENELAQAQERLDTEQSFEAEQDCNDIKDIVEALEYQLTILELARNESVTSSLSLREMKDAIKQNERSIRSLLTTEVPNWRRTLATAGMALDTFETTKVASMFRNHLEQTQDDTGRAALEAMRASDAGRVDNPERLERAIQRTIEFRKSIEERAQAQIAMEDTIAKRLAMLKEETTALLSTGNKGMIEHAASEGTLQLEHQRAAVANDDNQIEDAIEIEDAVEADTEELVIEQPKVAVPKLK